MRLLQGRTYKTSLFHLFLLSGFFLMIWTNVSSSQERDAYLSGENGQLEMVVHIIGEVKKPGEYRVVDSTNLMELISKAEGPTEFSNLRSVTITRPNTSQLYTNGNGTNGRSHRSKRIIKFNVKDYLKQGKVAPPKLRPGDIVMVPRNNWHKWRNGFTIIRDLSVVASVYLLYLRSTK